MPVVLFLDELGARSRWIQGGAAAAKAGFLGFHRLIVGCCRRARPGTIVGGGLETDSAMLVCDTASGALELARTIFRATFRTANNPSTPRRWLRGSLVPAEACDMRTMSTLRAPLQSLSVATFSSAAFHAISLEKSGFKGMRLLVAKDLATRSLSDEVRIPVGSMSFIPLKRLRHSYYPPLPGMEAVDYLWMSDAESIVAEDLQRDVANRLRFAATNREEFEQAAATQVVFNECAAIFQAQRSRDRRRMSRKGN